MVAETQIWELWYPDAASTGLLLARARIDPAASVWVHAAPPTLSVTVRGGDGQIAAEGHDLDRAGERLPMTRLRVEGAQVCREDRWPREDDLGSLVILPGGEAGTLVAWWNAPDGSEWRWRVEFYNHR